MLSRSNFSIRRLISQRRSQDAAEDEGSFFLQQDEGASLKGTAKQQKAWSWTPPKQLAKKFPKPIIIVRASEDLHRISHLPPLPDTPYSSKSSLCSCEYHNISQASTRRPRSRSPALCSVPSKIGPERRSHSRICTLAEDGQLSPQLPWTGEEKQTPQTMAAEPTLDSLEALSLQPGTEPGPPTTTLDPTNNEAQNKEVGESLGDNVQQLIRETDEAFGSVGFALADGRLGPDGLETDKRPVLASAIRSFASQPNSPKNLRRIATSNLKSPTRTGSISKPKRDGSQNSRRPRPATRRIPKWTDNAKDLFNIRLFNRIEADEMLPPNRLEEIRLSRLSPLRPKKSTETMRTFETDGSETPSEPFHLQDLPARIGAAGVSLSVPSPVEEVRTPPLVGIDPEVVREEPPPDTKDITADKEIESPEEPQAHADDLAYEDLSFPAPPAKNPLRFVSKRQPPHLAAIPEVMITSPENAILSPSSDPSASKQEAFVFLPCRPFTLTMPTFRHGPIRLAKADLAVAYSSSKLAAVAVDETLDWTAFQMAILGGAGDFFGEATDFSRRSDAEEDELDELHDWFESFGFESHGRLVSEQRRSTLSLRLGSATAEHSPARLVAAGESLPIPVEHEHPQGFWNQGKFDAGRFYSARSFGVRRWAVEGHPKRYEKSLMSNTNSTKGRRPSAESVQSLPQSPMPDLMVGSGSAGGREEIVPMGYNLGHDLGDFLKWEAEHVYAAGFQGAGKSSNNDV